MDRTNEVFPVIMFLNNNLEQYKRIIYSESIDMVINIFSVSDFEVMLQTLKLPMTLFRICNIDWHLIRRKLEKLFLMM